MRILLLAITIVGWASWSFLAKLTTYRLHPLQMFIVGCVVNILLLPVYAFSMKTCSVNNSWHPGSIAICAAASLASAMGSLAYTYGIRTGELGTIAVLSCAYPLLTTLLAIIFLGESITTTKVIGIMFVIIGVVVLGR